MSHYLSDADRKYGVLKSGFQCRGTVVAWPPQPPKQPGGRPGGTPSRKGRRFVTREPVSSAAAAAAAAAAPGGPPEPIAVDCIFTLSKERMAQAVDVVTLLVEEFEGLLHSDVWVQYRGQPVDQFEIIADLPDWDGEPRLQLLIQPTGYAAAKQIVEQYGVQSVPWPETCAAAKAEAEPAAGVGSSSGGGGRGGDWVDWIERQAEVEAALADAYLGAAAGANAAGHVDWLASQLAAEAKLDALMADFTAAAAEVLHDPGLHWQMHGEFAGGP